MKLVVVGAGTMGQGIAQVALSAGWDTFLVDLDQKVLGASHSAIARRLGRLEGVAGSLDAVDGLLANLRLGTDLAEACTSADAVIETASEDLRVKVDILEVAIAASPADAAIGTNTSALSITEMGAACGAPDRVVGIHFFNPVPRMQLVEVIRGLDTSPEAVARAVELSRALGKQAVVIRDSPGFVASRVNALIGNEAFAMLSEGVASAEDIDSAVRLGLNHPMGPFELGDLVGWDVRIKVLQYLHATLGDRFRPSPLMLKYVESGRLGRKSGRGVYEYSSS